MKRHTKILTLLVLFVVLLSTGVVAAEGKAPGIPLIPKDDRFATLRLSPAQQERAIAYWTAEKNAALQPLAMPVDMSGGAPIAAELNAVDPYGGRIVRVPPVAAAPNAEEMARADYPEAWAALDEEALVLDEPLVAGKDALTGTSQQYTGYFLDATQVQKMYPHPWVGRFVFSGGSCTATAIANSHIVTAAHCVYDTFANRWYSSFAFQPAYRAGNVPYGTFPASSCTILTSWINRSGSYSLSWAQDDIAVCAMGKNSAGKTLLQMTGNAGYETNAAYVRHLHQMGYPGRDYRNQPIAAAGKYLHTCVGETFKYATDIRGVGCNMGPGISGGPWLTGYALNRWQTGWVSGVSSGMMTGVANTYGIRFSSANIVPLCNYSGC